MHRVQRVPVTESSGRIHTSTVTVAVLPEVDDVEIHINPNDLETRHLRFLRTGRTAHAEERHRRADHAQAHGNGRDVRERALADAEQAARDGRACARGSMRPSDSGRMPSSR